MMNDNAEQIIQKNLNNLIAEGHDLNNIAFSYARVSSERQEKGNSREDQVMEAEEYAKHNDLHLIHTFATTESAWHDGRMDFNYMIELALKFKVKNLIFKNYDRLSRNHIDWGRSVKLIKEKGIQLHFFEQSLILNDDSTAEEMLMGNFGAVLANYWSNKISQSIKRSHKNKAEKRGVAIKAPMGYKWDDIIKNFIINKEEEHIIREIFELYDSKEYSMVEVAEIVNAKGYRTNNGNRFSSKSINKFLKNPFYSGVYRFKGVEYKGKHPAYITEERFAERLEFIEQRFRGHRKQSTNFLLSKFMKCSVCGSMITAYKVKDKYVYYDHKCSQSVQVKGRLRELEVLEMIDKEVARFCYSEEYTQFLKKVFKTSIGSKNSLTQRRRHEIEKQIHSLDQKKQRFLDLYGDGELDKEMLYKEINQVKNDIIRLKEQLDTLDDDLSKYEYKVVEVIDYLRNFSKTYSEDEPEGRIQLLRTVATGVYLNRDTGEVEILWKKPFSFLLQKEIIAVVSPNEKRESELSLSKFKGNHAGHEGIEPPTLGFGDRCST